VVQESDESSKTLEKATVYLLNTQNLLSTAKLQKNMERSKPSRNMSSKKVWHFKQ